MLSFLWFLKLIHGFWFLSTRIAVTLLSSVSFRVTVFPALASNRLMRDSFACSS